MKALNTVLAEKMRDPEFASEYNRLEPEYAAIQALIDARQESNTSLADLSRSTGIKPQNLSRIEKGETNPTVKTLARIATGLGKRLEIRFV